MLTEEQRLAYRRVLARCIAEIGQENEEIRKYLESLNNQLGDNVSEEKVIELNKLASLYNECCNTKTKVLDRDKFVQCLTDILKEKQTLDSATPERKRLGEIASESRQTRIEGKEEEEARRREEAQQIEQQKGTRSKEAADPNFRSKHQTHQDEIEQAYQSAQKNTPRRVLSSANGSPSSSIPQFQSLTQRSTDEQAQVLTLDLEHEQGQRESDDSGLEPQRGSRGEQVTPTPTPRVRRTPISSDHVSIDEIVSVPIPRCDQEFELQGVLATQEIKFENIVSNLNEALRRAIQVVETRIQGLRLSGGLQQGILLREIKMQLNSQDCQLTEEQKGELLGALEQEINNRDDLDAMFNQVESIVREGEDKSDEQLSEQEYEERKREEIRRKILEVLKSGAIQKILPSKKCSFEICRAGILRDDAEDFLGENFEDFALIKVNGTNKCYKILLEEPYGKITELPKKCTKAFLEALEKKKKVKEINIDRVKNVSGKITFTVSLPQVEKGSLPLAER